MIRELRIRNFRGFEDYTIPLKSVTVIVGRNNAGKSTVVEALSLVSRVVDVYRGANYKNVPDWLDIEGYAKGISPSLKGLDIKTEGIFHRYRRPPASITATFTSREQVRVYLGPDGQVFAVIMDADGHSIYSKKEAHRVDLPRVSILPQVGPLEPDEQVLRKGYVLDSLGTSLTSRHFRNQISVLYKEAYSEFKQLAESTWKGFRLQGLQRSGEFPNEGTLALLVQNEDFVGEIGWMGHGLQMWMQVMWFLAYNRSATNQSTKRSPQQGGEESHIKHVQTVILDEPDVYMHPDLQRKLVRLIKGRYPQTIIATHSVEMMAEVPPENILMIERSEGRARFASDIPSAQRIIDHIGGVHNLHLARFATARRFLLVEGKDLKLLKHVQDAFLPHSSESLDTIPNASIGGWGNWKYAIGSGLAIKQATFEGVTTYCILDRDYRTSDQIRRVQVDAKQHGIQLHVWSKKEIENYFIIPSAIQRVIASRIGRDRVPPSVNEVAEAIDQICTSLETSALDDFATEIQNSNKGYTAGKANSVARQELEQRGWGSFEGRISLVSGKEVFARLSEWSSTTLKTSISVEAVARELTASEVPLELQTVLSVIDRGLEFPS